MKTSEFKSFILDYTKINESAQRVLHGSTFRMPRFEVATVKRGLDDAVRIFDWEMTLPKDSEYDDVFVVQFISDLGEVVAQTHDPSKFRDILTVISETYGPDSPRVFWKNLEETLDVSDWTPKEIVANHWKATILTAFFTEALMWYYPENRPQSENYYWRIGDNYAIRTATGIALPDTKLAPEERLGFYKNWKEAYLADFYKLYLIHIHNATASRKYMKDIYLKDVYKWVLAYSYINSIDVPVVRGMVIVPVTNNVDVKGVKLWAFPHRLKERYGSIDFSSIRSLFWLKKNYPEDYKVIEDYVKNYYKVINILSIRIGDCSSTDLSWEEGNTILDRFNEVENPSFYRVKEDKDCYVFVDETVSFIHSRNGEGKKKTFRGCIKRADGMFFNITDLTWDQYGAFFTTWDILSHPCFDKDEIEDHVFSKEDFRWFGEKIRYYGDYADYKYSNVDMVPCIWFDNGKVETSHLDDWPYVEPYLGRPTKQINAAVLYLQQEVLDMIEEDFPSLMKDQFPKENGFWLLVKSVLGKTTKEAVDFVREQVRLYTLRLEVFDLIERLYDNDVWKIHPSKFLEWSKGSKPDYDSNHWKMWMWARYPKWTDKLGSLERLKTILQEKEEKYGVKFGEEYKTPTNLPKYIEVLWDDVFKGSIEGDYISGFGGDVTPIKALVRTLTGEAYYQTLKNISLVGSDGSSYPWVRFKIKTNSLAYLFLGMYNMLRKRGRNWHDFERTHESSLSQDPRHMWVWKKYWCISTDDGRRIEIFSPSVKIKIIGDCIRIQNRIIKINHA